jgi:hypothetical protein
MSWTDILSLAIKLPSLSTVTSNIKDATNDSIATYDVVSLRVFKGKLIELRDDVINVNSKKLENLQDMQAYVNKTTFHKSWSQLQTNWAEISKGLSLLIPNITVGTNVGVMTLAAATELKTALSRQKNFYDNLSTMSEPQNNQQLIEFKQIYGILKGLFDEVQALETAIDGYLAKHTS